MILILYLKIEYLSPSDFNLEQVFIRSHEICLKERIQIVRPVKENIEPILVDAAKVDYLRDIYLSTAEHFRLAVVHRFRPTLPQQTRIRTTNILNTSAVIILPANFTLDILILPHGVTEFHTDNGSEYVNSDMEKFCEELCITRTYTVPFSPQLNPYSERTWGSLLRKVRTALVDSNVPHVFWTYCMSQAAMVCSALLGEKGKSTYEMAWGKPFDYKTLHVWGCKVYYLVPEHERPSKLAPRALEAVYLGPDPKRNGHVVWIPQLRKITTAYHVVFSEDLPIRNVVN